MIKTIRFGINRAAPLPESWAMPPGENMCFGNRPDIPLRLRSVQAFARVRGELRMLPVKQLEIGDPADASDAVLYRRVPVDGAAVGGVRVDPYQSCLAVVENDTGEVVRPKVVLRGEWVDGAVSHESRVGSSFTLALKPRAAPSIVRRLVVHQGDIFTRYMPCAGKVHKITMRSDSELDVDVIDVRFSNESLTVGGVVPVEFYKDGWAVEPFDVEGYFLMSVTVRSQAAVDRWIEIDVDFEPKELT